MRIAAVATILLTGLGAAPQAQAFSDPVIRIREASGSPLVRTANQLLVAVQTGKPRLLAALVAHDATLTGDETVGLPKLTFDGLADRLSRCRAADREDLKVGTDVLTMTMMCDFGGKYYAHYVRFEFHAGKVSHLEFRVMVEPPSPSNRPYGLKR